MTSDNTCIIGCFQLKNENRMCEHPAHHVNTSRIGVLCAPDSSKFFWIPCIADGLKGDLIISFNVTLPKDHINIHAALN